MSLSTPTLCGFSPDFIPYQRSVCDLIRDFDFTTGYPEVLLSGAFGSAKTTLMVHLGIRHAVENRGAVVCLARRSLPDLKKTIWLETLEHIAEDMKEGVDYKVNKSEMRINFRNGSKVICSTWADGKYKKARSVRLSCLLVEEIVENDENDSQAYKELKQRLGRVRGIAENFVIAATNPDEPDHWVYQHWIAKPHATRFVFYSKMEENPFLPRAYVEQKKRDMSPLEWRRFGNGEWLTLKGNVIYQDYDSDRQYRKTEKYKINKDFPVWMTHDFNIGEGKPISAIMFQYIHDRFHFFNEIVIHSASTGELIDEWADRGVFAEDFLFYVTGDAAGKHRDTRSKESDYDIIFSKLQLLKRRFRKMVPLSNPPIRTRHNRVNGYCLNELGQTRIYLYEGCEYADKGLRMTKLLKGANYLEDDSKDFQHISTGIGYGVCMASNTAKIEKQGTILL